MPGSPRAGPGGAPRREAVSVPGLRQKLHPQLQPQRAPAGTPGHGGQRAAPSPPLSPARDRPRPAPAGLRRLRQDPRCPRPPRRPPRPRAAPRRAPLLLRRLRPQLQLQLGVPAAPARPRRRGARLSPLRGDVHRARRAAAAPAGTPRGQRRPRPARPPGLSGTGGTAGGGGDSGLGTPGWGHRVGDTPRQRLCGGGTDSRGRCACPVCPMGARRRGLHVTLALLGTPGVGDTGGWGHPNSTFGDGLEGTFWLVTRFVCHRVPTGMVSPCPH